MITSPSTIRRNPPTSHAVRLDDMFWAGSSHGANIAATRNPCEMSHYKSENQFLSRRRFLKSLGLAPMLFCPVPFHASSFLFERRGTPPSGTSGISFVDTRLTPHYPTKSPLEDVLRLVA